MKKYMGNILNNIVVFFILASIYIIIYIAFLEEPINHYEYIDLANNKGIAKTCESYKGGLICKLEDETVVQVKQYKAIRGE